MIATAVILATITTVGFFAIYMKLPKNVRKYIQKHAFFSDLLALFAIYILLGGTLTALMAAAICGVFISILLYISKNKEEFPYLEDFYQISLVVLKKVEKKLTEYTQKYRIQCEETIEDLKC